MKSKILGFLAVVLLAGPMAASANIIYTVDQLIGAGSVVGTIETNGTLGTINAADILDWTFTLTSPSLTYGSPAVISSASGGSINDASMGNLSATASDIVWNYAGAGPAYLLFWGSDFQHYYCLQTSGCFD